LSTANTKTLVFGPGLTSGRPSKVASNIVEGLKDLGHLIHELPKPSTLSKQEMMELATTALASAQSLVLLPGWEDVDDAVVLGQLAHSLGAEAYAWVDMDEGPGLRRLTLEDVRAPLMPGQGILAPDSDHTELPHEEAARIVLGPRGAYYDTPLRNLGRTGLIWSGILYGRLKPGETISAEDVALCMVGVKLARQAFRHKRDNLTDSHGYLMTIEMIRKEKDRLRAEGILGDDDE